MPIALIWEIHLSYCLINFSLELGMVVNLPTDVLRTFLAVIDLGSFTKAGQLLGRTQPAISLQIRKLEQLVGMTLMDTSGRNIALTIADRDGVVGGLVGNHDCRRAHRHDQVG